MAVQSTLYGFYSAAVSSWKKLQATVDGILYTLGGHPTLQTTTTIVTAASGAQTNLSLLTPVVDSTTRVAVTMLAVAVDSATTAAGGVSVKIGFAAATLAADSLSGASNILLHHPGIAAGSGIVLGNGSGIIGMGAADEELRLTCEAPTGGSITITYTYFSFAA